MRGPKGQEEVDSWEPWLASAAPMNGTLMPMSGHSWSVGNPEPGRLVRAQLVANRAHTMAQTKTRNPSKPIATLSLTISQRSCETHTTRDPWLVERVHGHLPRGAESAEKPSVLIKPRPPTTTAIRPAANSKLRRFHGGTTVRGQSTFGPKATRNTVRYKMPTAAIRNPVPSSTAPNLSRRTGTPRLATKASAPTTAKPPVALIARRRVLMQRLWNGSTSRRGPSKQATAHAAVRARSCR